MINTAAAVHATATEAVLRNHLRAATLGADAVMRDYTEESVLITHDATYRGLAEIRRFFDGSSFELSMTTDRGDVRRASSRAPVPSGTRPVRDRHTSLAAGNPLRSLRLGASVSKNRR